MLPGERMVRGRHVRPSVGGASVGAAAPVSYLDARGAPWVITSYDTPQFLSGKTVSGASVSYRAAAVGGDSVNEVKLGIRNYIGSHPRDPVNLFSGNRYSTNYAGVNGPVTLKDNVNGDAWFIYQITDAGQGAPGFYATNVESSGTPIGSVVGPASSLLNLNTMLNAFVGMVDSGGSGLSSSGGAGPGADLNLSSASDSSSSMPSVSTDNGAAAGASSDPMVTVAWVGLGAAVVAFLWSMFGKERR